MVGQLYQQLPLHMNLHFIHQIGTPSVQGESTGTDMILYYGKNDFYMQAEGMEQIANDSLLVLVNSEAKRIGIYPNDKTLQKSLLRSASLITTDSSVDAMVERYSASLQDEGQNRKRIILQTREKVFGTALPKETISVSYYAGSHQPVSFEKWKTSLVPVDSALYSQLINDSRNSGKVIRTNTKEGVLFFMVKEQYTNCRFTKVSHDMKYPPVHEQDRITKLPDGTYQAAKGLEDYILSKEF